MHVHIVPSSTSGIDATGGGTHACVDVGVGVDVDVGVGVGVGVCVSRDGHRCV